MNKRVYSTPTGRPEGRGREIAPSVKTTLKGEYTRFLSGTSIEDWGTSEDWGFVTESTTGLEAPSMEDSMHDTPSSILDPRYSLLEPQSSILPCNCGGKWLSAVESCKEQHGLMPAQGAPATAICMSCGCAIHPLPATNAEIIFASARGESANLDSQLSFLSAGSEFVC